MHKIDQQLNLMVRGEFQDAWNISQQIESETPDDLRHMFNRGWFFIKEGDFETGYQLLEAGRFLRVYGDKPLPTRQPIWDKSDPTAKTIIINLEGGYGDHVIFARFATCLADRGATVILCGHPHLKNLLSSIRGVTKYITVHEVQSIAHDFWVPAFSLVWLLGHTPDSLPKTPYITPPQSSVEVWRNMITGDKLKVGIRWAGNPDFEHHQFRQFPADPLINLSNHSTLQVYSFQRDNDTRELPDNIIDLQHLLLSWDDTAAAIAHMDIVISSCTSVAHVAAAMGKPTWILLPILPYHIWADGNEYSVWYPKTTRLFRQSKFANWDDPLHRMEQQLITEFDL
jgi:hypothetical protein